MLQHSLRWEEQLFHQVYSMNGQYHNRFLYWIRGRFLEYMHCMLLVQHNKFRVDRADRLTKGFQTWYFGKMMLRNRSQVESCCHCEGWRERNKLRQSSLQRPLVSYGRPRWQYSKPKGTQGQRLYWLSSNFDKCRIRFQICCRLSNTVARRNWTMDILFQYKAKWSTIEPN